MPFGRCADQGCRGGGEFADRGGWRLETWGRGKFYKMNIESIYVHYIQLSMVIALGWRLSGQGDSEALREVNPTILHSKHNLRILLVDAYVCFWARTEGVE